MTDSALKRLLQFMNPGYFHKEQLDEYRLEDSNEKSTAVTVVGIIVTFAQQWLQKMVEQQHQNSLAKTN